MASSIAPSSAERRENIARGDAPAAFFPLEHQRAVGVEIDKPATEGTAFEAYADLFPQPARPREPGEAQRRKTLRAPASRPDREMPGYGAEQHRRRDRRHAFGRE